MPDSSSSVAITVTGLRKSFGGHTALDGIDLLVPSGTVCSLLAADVVPSSFSANAGPR